MEKSELVILKKKKKNETLEFLSIRDTNLKEFNWWELVKKIVNETLILGRFTMTLTVNFSRLVCI